MQRLICFDGLSPSSGRARNLAGHVHNHRFGFQRRRRRFGNATPALTSSRCRCASRRFTSLARRSERGNALRRIVAVYGPTLREGGSPTNWVHTQRRMCQAQLRSRLSTCAWRIRSSSTSSGSDRRRPCTFPKPCSDRDAHDSANVRESARYVCAATYITVATHRARSASHTAPYP